MAWCTEAQLMPSYPSQCLAPRPDRGERAIVINRQPRTQRVWLRECGHWTSSWATQRILIGIRHCCIEFLGGSIFGHVKVKCLFWRHFCRTRCFPIGCRKKNIVTFWAKFLFWIINDNLICNCITNLVFFPPKQTEADHLNCRSHFWDV